MEKNKSPLYRFAVMMTVIAFLHAGCTATQPSTVTPTSPTRTPIPQVATPIPSTAITQPSLPPTATPETSSGAYLGQAPLGLMPQVFAPGIVSIPGTTDYAGSFSPDGTEFYFTRGTETSQNIYETHLSHGVWSEPAQVAFSAGYDAHEPHVTFDNQTLYFGWFRPRPPGEKSTMPADIWATDRTASGWSSPRYVGEGMAVSSDQSGHIYVTNVDTRSVGQVTVTNGRFTDWKPINAGAHPCIAPDGSYLLYDLDGTHLYVRFRLADGQWSAAKDLTQHGMPVKAGIASISPDGKYLFYGYQEDLYWVSTELITNLAETAPPSPTATPTPTATASPTRAPMVTAASVVTLYPEPGTRIDTKTYGGRYNDWGYDILLLDDGGTLIVGQADNTGPSHRITPGKARLIRTDAEGNVIWQRDYGGEVDSMFYSPIQVGDDEYVILGQIAASYSRDEEDIYLVKVDGEGNEIWSHTYGGQGMDHGKMVRQTADGGFILVGDRADAAPRNGLYQSDLVLIKTDAEGNKIWTQTYGNKILYIGWSVAQTPDGGYVLAGWEAKTIPDRDVIAIKTDAAGEVEWSRSWDLDPGDRDGGFDMILTADGHVVIAGIQSMDSGPRGAALIKVDLKGNEVWVKVYDAGGEGSEFWDILEDKDGGYVMAGSKYLTPLNPRTGEAIREGLIIKTDPDGEVLWQHTLSSSEYKSTLLSSAVILPDHGYIFVGGAMLSSQRYWDMLWAKLAQ